MGWKWPAGREFAFCYDFSISEKQTADVDAEVFVTSMGLSLTCVVLVLVSYVR